MAEEKNVSGGAPATETPVNAGVELMAEERDQYSLVSIRLTKDVVEPEALKSIHVPQVNCQKGVILSGRAPVWIFAYLTHAYHPTAWVATHDPRLGGGVVVMSHSPTTKVGEVVKL